MTQQPARRIKWSCSLVEIHNNSLGHTQQTR